VIEIKSAYHRTELSPPGKFHNYHSGASGIETPTSFPNQRTEFHPVNPPILRSGSYRGSAATANHFARESHIDESRARRRLDPFEFRMKNLKEPRLRNVLEAAPDPSGAR